MRSKLIGTAFVVCALQALAARATSPDLTPSSGTLGTLLYVQQLAFRVTRASRVRLVPRPGQTGLRTVATKRRSSDRDVLRAEVTTGLAGVYDVVVVRGAQRSPRVTASEPFEILGPSVESTEATIATAGSTIIVRGAHFGPHTRKLAAKDRVTVGGRRLEISSWTDDAITCSLPFGVPSGAQPVVVTTAAGASDGTVRLFVTPPPDPPEFVRAQAGGERFQVNEHVAPGIVARLIYGGRQLLVDSFPGSTRITIQIDFPKLDKPTPYTLGAVNPDGEKLSLFWGGVTGSLSGTLPGPALSLTVTGWHDGILEGTFTGTFSTGAVANGAFRVHVDVFP